MLQIKSNQTHYKPTTVGSTMQSGMTGQYSIDHLKERERQTWRKDASKFSPFELGTICIQPTGTGTVARVVLGTDLRGDRVEGGGGGVGLSHPQLPSTAETAIGEELGIQFHQVGDLTDALRFGKQIWISYVLTHYFSHLKDRQRVATKTQMNEQDKLQKALQRDEGRREMWKTGSINRTQPKTAPWVQVSGGELRDQTASFPAVGPPSPTCWFPRWGG